MRSAGEQTRDRTTNLHCSKLSTCSQTSNSGSFHRSNSALRHTITLCKTWIRDQYPSYSGGDPILVELLVDAPERSSVESFGPTSNDCEPFKEIQSPSRDGYRDEEYRIHPGRQAIPKSD